MVEWYGMVRVWYGMDTRFYTKPLKSIPVFRPGL